MKIKKLLHPRPEGYEGLPVAIWVNIAPDTKSKKIWGISGQKLEIGKPAIVQNKEGKWAIAIVKEIINTIHDVMVASVGKTTNIYSPEYEIVDSIPDLNQPTLPKLNTIKRDKTPKSKQLDW